MISETALTIGKWQQKGQPVDYEDRPFVLENLGQPLGYTNIHKSTIFSDVLFLEQNTVLWGEKSAIPLDHCIPSLSHY